MTAEHDEKIALLRVLAASMWADGVATLEEKNFLKEVFNGFKLSRDQWKAIEPFVESPLTRRECEALIRDFLATVHAKRDVQNLKAYVREMFLADGELGEDEKQWRDGLLELLDGGNSVGLFLTRFGKWFRGGTTRRSEALRDFYDTEGYFRNKVLFHVKRAFHAKGLSLSSLEPGRLELLCLLGGILGKMAYADGVLARQEVIMLQERLSSTLDIVEEEFEVILQVIQDQIEKDLDLFRLVSEYRVRVSYQEKLDLVDVLLQIATTDHIVGKEEQQQLEEIVNLLRIDRSDFIAIRSRYWEQFDKYWER